MEGAGSRSASFSTNDRSAQVRELTSYIHKLLNKVFVYF
jgi:hypothetical protein